MKRTIAVLLALLTMSVPFSVPAEGTAPTILDLLTAPQEQEDNPEMQAELAAYDSLFLPGVFVDGIDLGGMTMEQARNAVVSPIQQKIDAWQVRLTYHGNDFFTISAPMLGMRADTDEVMRLAWEQGHSGTPEERYETMLRLQDEPFCVYTGQPCGDTSVVDNILSEIGRQLDRPPVDATVSEFRADLEDPFIYTDEITGMRLDTGTLKVRLYEMVSALESGTVEVDRYLEQEAPAVTREDLEAHRGMRSSVYTPISKHSTEERIDNIRLTCSRINGYILESGKTFSFNKVVGKRTEENGFRPAAEFVYGESAESPGGGVCQAGTALYQAAICAGLQIRERHAHSGPVDYTDYGKEAVVLDTGKHEKDLKFTNNTDNPVFIRAEVVEDPSNKKRLLCKITLYGESLGSVRYELVSEVTETLAPPEPQYVRDENGEYVVYTDEQKTVSGAREGYVCKSWRLKYDGGIMVEKEELYTDTYQAVPETIYVGVTVRE